MLTVKLLVGFMLVALIASGDMEDLLVAACGAMAKGIMNIGNKIKAKKSK